VHEPTSFIFNVAVPDRGRQRIAAESVAFEPGGRYAETAVGEEGNRIFRRLAEPGTLRLRYSATVELAPYVEPVQAPMENAHADLPDEVLSYLNPSRYCESDRLGQFAAVEFGALEPGYGRVAAIVAWVGGRMTYTAGSTDSRTTACDVLVQRTGVCRDYAHLAIALCRALGIPARYVSAYAVGLQPPDFHGYLEAYLGSEWYSFDATGKAPLSGLVRIGVGRDAADTSFATIVGAATLAQLNVEAVLLNG
jgi:transglutaminase-like putative cysteine protease